MSGKRIEEIINDVAIGGERQQNFFLVYGEVVFTHKADEAQLPNAIRVNGVVRSPDGHLAVPQLTQAQHSLRQAFEARVGKDNIIILDVVIAGLTSLGWFTTDEFNQKLNEPHEEFDPNELQPA